MRESIFSASLRSFFLTLFGVLGFLFGIILLFIIIGAINSSSDNQAEIAYTFTPEIKPNANGIRKSLSTDAPVILQLNINGIIGLDKLTQEQIENQLVESRERIFKNDRVKAILLTINSPGGTVVDADGIYRALKAYKEHYKVPVYAFANGLCASGGMYIACAADKIYASDVTLVGSVGVIIPSILNFSQLMEKIGVKSLTIYEGKGKDNLNPMRPWRAGEEDNIKDAVTYYYGNFVDIVTSNRPHMDKAKLIKEYGADIYPAQIAKEYGYIDENGASLNTVLKDLAEKIGIHDDYYQVITLESSTWISDLFKGNFSLLKGQITHQIELTPEMSPQLQNQYLYLYRP